jgi:hypothetical protein
MCLANSIGTGPQVSDYSYQSKPLLLQRSRESSGHLVTSLVVLRGFYGVDCSGIGPRVQTLLEVTPSSFLKSSLVVRKVDKIYGCLSERGQSHFAYAAVNPSVFCQLRAQTKVCQASREPRVAFNPFTSLRGLTCNYTAAYGRGQLLLPVLKLCSCL